MGSRMTLTQARARTGGLGHASKMPCATFGLPAIIGCPVGAKLALVPGSPCATCYADSAKRRASNYARTTVQAAQTRRLTLLRDAMRTREGEDAWVAAMVRLIGASKSAHFRWHDSGDIQNDVHLRMIVRVAQELPGIRFWLPTQERHTVATHIARGGVIPENLTVRISSPLRGRPYGVSDTTDPTRYQTIPGSFVTHSADYVDAVRETRSMSVHVCPAQTTDGHCGPCRACWNATVPTVAYPWH